MYKLFGIRFAPLFVPFERRIQTLAAGFLVYSFLFCVVVFYFSLYLVVFVPVLSPFVLIYFVWIYFDRKTCERGGRRINCLRNHTVWKYLRDYFPVNLIRLNDAEFDPKKNYLLCEFPHGVLATGTFCSFVTDACDFRTQFPKFTPYPITLSSAFNVPFYREYILALGGCSSSKASLNYLLSKPDGGNFVILVVGGAEESFYCRPGDYKLILKNRKGFVRVALNNGSPLVPVFSFGEIDIYSQVDNPPGSLLRKIQNFWKSITGVACIIPKGRGFFQYSVGPLPRRKPINVVVGKPIDVPKVQEPSEALVNFYHQQFITDLTKLFDNEKHKYIKNSNNVKLILV